jgi:hypothetical protein
MVDQARKILLYMKMNSLKKNKKEDNTTFDSLILNENEKS